jgi:hypothetical protein
MIKPMARGEGKAGCVIWAVLLLSAALVAYRYVPAKVSAMQLEDYMNELALMQSTARKPADFFVKEILARADEMLLPLKEENVSVKKTGKRVVMDVKYTVVLDLLVTDYPLTFEIHIDRPIFLS